VPNVYAFVFVFVRVNVNNYDDGEETEQENVDPASQYPLLFERVAYLSASKYNSILTNSFCLTLMVMFGVN